MATVEDLKTAVGELSTKLDALDAREAGEVSINQAVLDDTVAKVNAANAHIDSMDPTDSSTPSDSGTNVVQTEAPNPQQ